MIKLSSLVLEQKSQPKVVIMAGGAGAGKSYLLNQLQLGSLPQVNPDKYVEDPQHPAYNNLGQGAKLADQEADDLSNQKQNFVWDTTASNPTKVKELLNKGYSVYMVMVYTHPMISYISNFERERNIPSAAVFQTWRNVYQLIKEYYKLTKGNFSLYVSDRGGKYIKEVEAFNTAAKTGPEGIKDYLQKYNTEHGIGLSTFFTPVQMSTQEEEEFNKATQGVNWNKSDRSEDKAIKQAFLKSYKDIGTGPGKDKLQQVVNKYKAAKDKRDKTQLEVLDNIASMLYSPDFQQLLKSSTPQEIDNKIQDFLA
jgi:hypothetical protein